MNDLKILTIENVECYEQDGVAYLKLENVARGLGFTQEKNGVEYVRWETINGYLKEFGFPNKLGKDDFIPENIFYRLAMKAKNEAAEKFQAKVADEIIPSIRKTGSYHVQNAIPFNEQVQSLEAVASILNMNEASRLLMLETFYKQYNVPTDFLPKYELNGNKPLKALSKLLKDNECDLSAKSFNILLLNSGYLEIQERPSSKGEAKKFKALTEKGLKYGENAISPHNMKEVQPLYYADTFMELYKEVVTE